MNSQEKDEKYKSPLIDFKKSEIMIAVLAVISKKSRERNRTIAAVSLREIKNGLKKYYNKDFTERHILNIIHDLGTIIIRERDPRNKRRTIYKTNPNFVEDVSLTLVNLTNGFRPNNKFEGILYSPIMKSKKQKFLVIGHDN